MPPGVREDGAAFDSGTEEEFDYAYRLKKDIWFFFCDFPINPSKIDPIQLDKIFKFKNHLQELSQEYRDFSDEKEFRKMMISNISNWNKEQQIKSEEDMAQYEQLPTIPTNEDFKKFNRGF